MKIETMTQSELLAEATACEQRKEESFERCDTDGFLSQWANGINANLYRRQAELVANGGMARFPGLFEGDRRVAAKLIETRFGESWILRDDEAAKFGRKFIPNSYDNNSKIQRKLGLHQKPEHAPARAKIMSNGTGLSGCASAYIGCYRTGDKWGQDSQPIPEGPEIS